MKMDRMVPYLKLPSMKYFTLTLLSALGMMASLFGQQGASVSFEKYLGLHQAGGAVISPNGNDVAFTVTSTEWDANAFDSEIWLSRSGSEPFQLTRTTKGSSTLARFSPDGRWISFLADRGDKTQIYLISVNGGEAFPVTREEEGVEYYDWKPDGKQIAFTKTDPESAREKSVKASYGGFAVEGQDFRLSHLWIISIDPDSLNNPGMPPCKTADKDSGSSRLPCWRFPKAQRLTAGSFTVTGFKFSPDGNYIAYNHQPDPLIKSSVHADIGLLDLSSGKSRALVTNRSSDFLAAWSPDSKSILVHSALDDTLSDYYRNQHTLLVDIHSGKTTDILKDFDEQVNVVDWNSTGIYFTASRKMKTGLFVYGYPAGTVSGLDMEGDVIGNVSISRDGHAMAWSARYFDKMNEIFLRSSGSASHQLTRESAQIATWNTPVNQIISWKSRDSALIEGVLVKPRNFDPRKKYPLLCVIHGGPTGTDRPDPLASYVYPIMQWVEKGALVLRINYRGSAGYGERFRALNVRNLGVGDMWDVLSGIDYLQRQGMVDTSRMGCMGWSQGGYISAFLTTNTRIFKAISVGAGISNWITYYVNTDITPFTLEYLQANPWQDPSIYARTSPMTHINQASTPTLIQHGELDKRVPIPNAYELYRGLSDRGIPAKLIVYKGFGHGITKPKERLAAIWHNWIWFNHYLFGEPLEELP